MRCLYRPRRFDVHTLILIDPENGNPRVLKGSAYHRDLVDMLSGLRECDAGPTLGSGRVPGRHPKGLRRPVISHLTRSPLPSHPSHFQQESSALRRCLILVPELGTAWTDGPVVAQRELRQVVCGSGCRLEAGVNVGGDQLDLLG